MRYTSRVIVGRVAAARLAAGVALALASMGLVVRRLEAQDRNGFMGTPIASRQGSTIDCGDAGFLISLTERQTDRLVGVPFFGCIKATLSQSWDAASRVVRPGLGDSRRGMVTMKTCPDDSFIVGIEAITGSYSYDSHGGAKPQLPRMIADLAPVCRNPRYHELTLGNHHLTQTDDNQLRRVTWDGLGGPRSCRAGYAVVKISFSYDGTPGLDPANPFYDAALTCKRLPSQVKVVRPGSE
jgi:hypothetical protein